MAASRAFCSSAVLFGSFIAAWLNVECWADDGGGGGEDDLESYHVLAEGVGVIVHHLQQLLHGSMEGGNDFPEEEKSQ